MKKSLASFIALNRRSLLLLGVVASIAVFGFVTWQAGAQINRSALRPGQNKGKSSDKLDLSAYPESKRNRILADNAANDGDDAIDSEQTPAPPVNTDLPNGISCVPNTVIYAYKIFSPDDHLIRFNPATPGTIALGDDLTVTGFNSVDEYLESIDFRPANGQLYGIATDKITSRVVTVNTTTGVVTSVGGTFPAPGTPPGNGLFGFFGGDFNPVVDRIRETSDINSNRRFNPSDGTLTATDTNLVYAVGDPHFGAVPAVVNIAYSNNTAGAGTTTLYGIDSTQNTLVTIGSPGGSPVSPNSGQVFTVGALGVNPTNFGGFDIQQGTNVGYAALRVSSSSQLYKINLTTGAATLVGTIGGGTDPIDGLTVAMGPTAACADLAITKTDNTTTYTAGGQTTYQITANNFGVDPVAGATVTDTFPPEISSATWTCVGSGNGVCPASGAGNISASVDLPVGGSVTFTVTANIAAGATGSLVNTASVAAPIGVNDPFLGNNSATDTDTRIPFADLQITKTDNTSVVTAGGTTTYTIVASNAGPDPVTGATVTDNFPATITTVTWTCSGTLGGTCTPAGAGNINDSAVNLPVGASVTYSAIAQISPAATFGMSNTATVTPPAGVVDPTPANNSARDVDNICSGTTFSYSGAPVAIPDGTGAEVPGPPVDATLNVSGVGGPIGDINLSINGTTCSTTAGSTTVGLDHTFVGDLVLTLISPTNTQLVVINRLSNGGGGNSGNNFCQVVLDDSAGTTIQSQLAAAAPFTGSFQPNAPLSVFNGQNPNGTWTLRAQDFFVGDTGNIRAWSLNITACPTTAAGVSVSGRVTTPDGRGLRNARVVITDSLGNARTVTTSSFGTYQFDDVAVGDNYVIGVVSKQYRFSSQLIQVGDTLTDINFVGQD